MNTFTQKPGPRLARKQQTRAALLEAARGLFVERGFERTTIREVAERAGVAVGTVFVHFPDKSALLVATLDEQLEATLTRAWATLPRGPARAQLGHVVGALYRMYAKAPVLARVLIKESLFVEGPGKAASVARIVEFTQALAVVLARPGVLAPGLDVEDATGAVLAAYLGCLIEGLSADKLDPKRQRERFDRLIRPWLSPDRATRKGKNK